MHHIMADTYKAALNRIRKRIVEWLIENEAAVNTDHAGTEQPLRYIPTIRRAARLIKETANKHSPEMKPISYKTVERFLDQESVKLETLCVLAKLVNCEISISIRKVDGDSVEPVILGRRSSKRIFSNLKHKHAVQSRRLRPYRY